METSSGADLVAAVLVEDNQEDGHDHDDTDHDDGVEDRVEEPAANRRGVLGERCVDPADTNMMVSHETTCPERGGWNVDLQLLVALLRVEADRLNGGDHHHHAEGNGDEQHDDVLGSVLQSQLLIVRIHLLVRAAAI